MNVWQIAERVRDLRTAVESVGDTWQPQEWVINISPDDRYDLLRDQELMRYADVVLTHDMRESVYDVQVVVDPEVEPGVGLVVTTRWRPPRVRRPRRDYLEWVASVRCRGPSPSTGGSLAGCHGARSS